MSEEREAPVEAKVRALLPHTWHPFFGRFGRLTPIQASVAGPIVSGRAVLAVAPTASGKTKAVVAPLVERVLSSDARRPGTRQAEQRHVQAQQRATARHPSVRQATSRQTTSRQAAATVSASQPVDQWVQSGGRGALRVILLSPTRALCNDLVRRLRRSVERCRIRAQVKSGDASGFNDKDPPELLITTPESLDSMLCRRPRVLRTVRAVMIDELHLLADTARGDQLQCLLARLDKVAQGPVQRCAASATVPRAEALARTFLGQDAQVIIAGGARGPLAGRQRRIKASLEEAPTLDAASAAVARLAMGEEAARKVLIFANSRAQVEGLTASLSERPALRGRVYAHHGSLARGERMRVEKALLEAPAALCVATMTLEIGVDIGDVDMVVLLAPPPDVASLLQRVGRGNRRGDVTRVHCLYAGDLERWRFEHLLACAARGELFGDPVPFRPSVAAQQALSLLFQNPARWISAGALRARLPVEAARRISEEDCVGLLGQLAERGWLRVDARGRYLVEDRAVKAFEAGRLHANFHVERELQVVDELTGRAVGSIRLGSQVQSRLGRGDAISVALGGQRRQVARVTSGQVIVRSGDGEAAGGFIGREAPRYSFELAQSLARHLGLPDDVLIIDKPVDGTWKLVHFWGSLWGRLLEGVLRAAKGRQMAPRSHAFISPLLPGLLPEDERSLGSSLDVRAHAEAAVEGDLMGLARLLEPGPMLDVVPRAVLRRWVLEAVDLDAFVATASRARFLVGPWLSFVSPVSAVDPDASTEEGADVEL